MNSDFEILTLVTSRPSHRFFVTICVYKPPKGNLSKCIDFLNEILNHKILQKKEIWILGDFKTDLHKRDNSMTVLLHRFTKKWDLKHLVNQTTRPNNSGGTCIDLIMSNSPFISNHGVCNDMIAEHFTVFAIRKKQKENNKVTTEYVRDYSKFDGDNFCSLIDVTDWMYFENTTDPSAQWNFIYERICKILSIMCPYKVVHTRVIKKKWITKEIYKEY